MTTLEAIDARLRAVEAKVDGVAEKRYLPMGCACGCAGSPGRCMSGALPASPVSRPATGFRMSCPCGCGEELVVPVCGRRSSSEKGTQ